MRRVPEHLKRYLHEQDYARYSSEDQAVWRYIMRQLRDYLYKHAHPIYAEGLKKTGISVEEIPKIENINKALENFGWSAVAISGFIPPAAYLEFQSLNILPIATEMRSLEHIHYTPAPDIVHESAGHAPILVNADFAQYLKKYASITTHAIFSFEDLEQYEAIRQLSDLKEDSKSSTTLIAAAEQRLLQANRSIRYVSEAATMARLYWWTAEYGIVGSSEDPRIYGAGLLSSVGESRSCMKSDVAKLPLSIDCVNYSYDITEPQPQIFLSPDFKTLHSVLDRISEGMAYKRGGVFGLNKALEAKTVCSVELNTGLQISGILTGFELESNQKTPSLLRFTGPCQLSFLRQQLRGHSTSDHPAGLFLPLGHWKGVAGCPSSIRFSQQAWRPNNKVQVETQAGYRVDGLLEDIFCENDTPLFMKLFEARVFRHDQLLAEPSHVVWPLGTEIPSVFGGPADPARFGHRADFAAKILAPKIYSDNDLRTHHFFSEIRKLRHSLSEVRHKSERLRNFKSDFLQNFSHHWLVGVELLELATQLSEESISVEIRQHLEGLCVQDPKVSTLVNDGIRLATVS